jgi:hypothetical protein
MAYVVKKARLHRSSRFGMPGMEPRAICCIIASLVKPGVPMPKNEHTEAADHHEKAAKSHRTAAEHHEKGDHEAGHKHSEEAQGHSTKARERSSHAHGKSTEANSAKR